MMNFNDKQKKRRKIIVHSIVATCCAIILSVGIGSVAIGLNRPYSEINTSKTTLTLPDNFNRIINSNNNPQWEEALNLQVCFINHHQPTAKEYQPMNNVSFTVDNEDYTMWQIAVDDKHSDYLTCLHIHNTDGRMDWEPGKTYSPDNFKLYVSVEIIIHGFIDHYFMHSEPIDMTLVNS